VSEEPWRDPKNYEAGRLVRCLNCGIDCHKTHWGNWCYSCNVERIERINKQFKDLLP